jgi:hypothetical protein
MVTLHDRHDHDPDSAGSQWTLILSEFSIILFSCHHFRRGNLLCADHPNELFSEYIFVSYPGVSRYILVLIIPSFIAASVPA